MKQAGPFFWVKGFIMMALAANVNAQHNPFKAPLYWSVYEDQIVKEKAGLHDVHITEEEWLANIDWVDANLKDLGYTMICIDGWGDLAHLNDNGYRLTHSRHWKHDYAWWSAHLRARGMKLGMYGNPLWVHVADDDTERLIVGTDIPVSTLKDPDERAHFPWVHVDRPGAEEYIKGWIHFYADMGVDYYRIDFLSWFEDGWDRWMGRTGPKRPREHYITALRWMREAADERGMFLSLVMPHLYEEAAAELQYGHMIRINEDTLEGGWFRWSENKRGEKREGWSVYANAADGLTYWSHIAGRGRMILDPDFIRLNTFANDDEKRSVISLSLMAGGAVTVSDQHHTIGTDLWLYANRELLELNYDGFVGQPLTNDPTRVESQIWTGQMSNGDWIIGLFNRESEPQTRSITFASLGIEGEAAVRDLWAHENLGTMPAFREVIPPRGCRILRVVPADAGDRVPSIPTAMKVDAIQVGKVTGEDGHTLMRSAAKTDGGLGGKPRSAAFRIKRVERSRAVAVTDGIYRRVLWAGQADISRVVAFPEGYAAVCDTATRGSQCAGGVDECSRRLPLRVVGRALRCGGGAAPVEEGSLSVSGSWAVRRAPRSADQAFDEQGRLSAGGTVGRDTRWLRGTSGGGTFRACRICRRFSVRTLRAIQP
ncbi:MAG: hypothetical protein M5U15_15505 [Kiritimatiellae bacterium]|nr:hypothetical protein [Kiritimatiellia bacterium]